ncbi:hypothetical protein KOR42_10540 [Thalassoglobus neptunius]|uniref:Lipocalin-like domain-containing protein n=1 Tax=Thalassoglobus neptunius TaxID=1938619 RepID=A0A5C5X485_9PLAN|nr:hypothetical protein [Thalassoglobus neptunius]TWT57690.1 hypothetical protein KOR42_10540 [Thalassoglobus neptunius]
MFRVIPVLALVFSSSTIDAAETLRDSLWRVTSVERNGKPSDDFTGTESTNGRVTAEYTLGSVHFAKGKLTFRLVTEAQPWNVQELVTKTSRLPAGQNGRFRGTVLGKQTDFRYTIVDDVLVLTVLDSPSSLVIKAKPFHAKSTKQRLAP